MDCRVKPGNDERMAMRQKTEFSCCQPLSQKYSEFSELNLTPYPNHFYRYAIPSHTEGRLAIVTDAGRDAVDADALLTNGAEADGEVVWS